VPLYRKPAITVNEAAKTLGLTHTAANELLRKMVVDSVLEEITGYQRNRVFMFTRYLRLFADHVNDDR